ncbi:MAG: hypothetical protein GC180_04985 [Bacteroidetes bacterium]|nr:hypothetical protein [Bacteroidota bacterium]
MNKNKFDQWLNESLEDHASAIPVGGWRGLQSNRKSKRQYRIWYFLLSGILATGVTAFYFIQDHKVPSAGLHEQPSPVGSPKLTIRSNSSDIETPVSEYPKSATAKSHSMMEFTPARNADKERIVQGPMALESEKVLIQRNQLFPIQLERRSLQRFMLPPDSLLPVIRVRRRILNDSNAISPESIEMQANFTRWIPYAELSCSVAALRANSVNYSNQDPQYLQLINGSRLTISNYAVGFGMNFRPVFQINFQAALRFQLTQINGTLDYHNPSLQPALNPQNFGSTSWGRNNKVSSNSYQFRPKVSVGNLQFALGAQYWLNPRFYAGALALPTLRLSQRGFWVNPGTLEPEVYQEPKWNFNLSAELFLGYAFRVREQQLRIQYRFSPWSPQLRPFGTQMGGNTHGVSIQWQMPSISNNIK